jgi:hypothetical protein
MTRFLLVLVAALCVAPAALADGIAPFATQGGPGALAPDGSARFVAFAAGTDTRIERIDAHGGGVLRTMFVQGAWGIPVATYTNNKGEGVSPDGSTLVVGDVVHTWPHARSAFLFIDPQTLRIRHRLTLRGDFAFDALSPDAGRLYLIQHLSSSDTTRYVVRAVNTTTMRLLPHRIADRTQRNWVMVGYPQNRVTSKDGRYVYTLYGNPKNVPFIHALDTVRGVAHCIGLPLRAGDQSNLVLALRNGDRTLAVHWLSGRPWYTVDTRSWQLARDHGADFPWWTLALLTLLLPLLAVGRRRYHLARDGGRTRTLAPGTA